MNFTFCGAPACINSRRHYHDDTVSRGDVFRPDFCFCGWKIVWELWSRIVLEALRFQALESNMTSYPRDRSPGSNYRHVSGRHPEDSGLWFPLLSLCSETASCSSYDFLYLTAWAVLSSDQELLAPNSWWRLFSPRTSAGVYDCPGLQWPAVLLFTEPTHSLSWLLVTGCQRWESLTEILVCKKRQLLPERWGLKDRWELCTASESRAFLTPVGVPTMHESVRDGVVLVQLVKGMLGVIFLRHTRKPGPDCCICCPYSLMFAWHNLCL